MQALPGGTFADVVDSTIHSIVDEASEQAALELEGTELFQMYQIDKEDERIQGMAGAGYGTLTLQGQQYAANTLWRDYPASVTVRKYTSELIYTEEDVYFLERMMKSGNETGVQLRLGSITDNAIPPLTGNINSDLAKSLYLGFGTTFFTGGDGVALLSASHPIRATGGTQSNSGTLAFSAANLRTTIDAMNNFRGQNGRRLKKVRRFVVVCHSDLEADVQQALDSLYGPGNGNLGLQTASSQAFSRRGVTAGYITLTEIPAAYHNYWFVVDLDRAARRFFLAYAWLPRSNQKTETRNGTQLIDSSTIAGPVHLGFQHIYGHAVPA
jgi:hypothetical protein